MKCSRCKKEAKLLWESIFDVNSMICVHCKELEEEHPLYPNALMAIEQAFKEELYDFEGIGIPFDLVP